MITDIQVVFYGFGKKYSKVCNVQLRITAVHQQPSKTQV
jgi:hypothetical protein